MSDQERAMSMNDEITRVTDAVSARIAQTPMVLEPGYVVALTLKPDAAPLRAYVGEVQTIDARGVRITLVDWFIGSFSSWDLFVPWEQIVSALVATPEHDIAGFGDAAGKWQERMDKRKPRVHAPPREPEETPSA